MNPDQILNQQEGVLYMDPSWNKSTTPKPGYIAVKVRTISYGDGRIVRTALNDDGSVLGDIDTAYDPDQKKIYDAAQPKPPAAPDPELDRQRKLANEIAAREAAERAANAALDPSLDPRDETNAQRAKRADEKRAAEKLEADKAAATAKADAEKAAAPKPLSPIISTRTEKDEATGRTVTVNTHQDGTETRAEVNVTKAPEKQETKDIDGVPHRVVRDEAGNVVRYEPIEIASEGTDPTFIGTMPTYIPQSVADDLTAYSQEVGAAVASGAISKARGTALVDARLRAAGAAVDSELDAAQSIYQAGVTQRGQDVNQSNQAMSTSSANFGKSLDIASAINGRVKQGSDAGYRLFEALLREGQEQARAYGANLDQMPATPVPEAVKRAANITVQAPDGTVVTIPSGVGTSSPQPPDPGMTQQQLLESVQRPDVVTPEQTPAPEAVSSGLPPGSQASRLLEPRPTGIAAIDSMGQQMAAPPPRTFASVEDKFRSFGMDEDAIQASRRNFMGLGAA